MKEFIRQARNQQLGQECSDAGPGHRNEYRMLRQRSARPADFPRLGHPGQAYQSAHRQMKLSDFSKKDRKEIRRAFKKFPTFYCASFVEENNARVDLGFARKKIGV